MPLLQKQLQELKINVYWVSKLPGPHVSSCHKVYIKYLCPKIIIMLWPSRYVGCQGLFSIFEGRHIPQVPYPAGPSTKENSVRREQLTQALNCSCTSELNTWAFTINLIVNAPVFSSDVQLQFSAWLSCSLLTEYSLDMG